MHPSAGLWSSTAGGKVETSVLELLILQEILEI